MMSSQFKFNPLTQVLAFILLTAFSLPASAQSADKILKKATAAAGGEKIIRAVRAREVTGKITRLADNEGGTYRLAAKQPNLFIEHFELGGLEAVSGYNGKSGWRRDSRDGLRTVTGAMSGDLITLAAYSNSRWVEYKREKSKAVTGPPVQVNGQSALPVTLTTVRGTHIKLYFDSRTSLLVRDEIAQGEVTRISDYSDYRAVNGVKEPHRVTIALGNERYEITVTDIAHNRALAQSRFDFPKISTVPLPDIPGLLAEVSKNGDEIDRMLEKYTYTQHIIMRIVDQSGKLQDKNSETFELTFYKGNRLRRKIAKDGKPLSAGDLEDENKRIAKKIREIEKKDTEKQRKVEEGDGDDANSEEERITISDVLRASNLVNPRRERFRGRDVIVFDFEPNPTYKPRKNYEKFFGKMAGALWVDDADKQVARVEARLVDSFKIAGGLLASLKEGGSFVLEQNRVNNEIWLPTRADISLSARVLLVKTLNAMQTVTYGNYQRFDVEAEKERLANPVAEEKKP
jgi:hypothetical protein